MKGHATICRASGDVEHVDLDAAPKLDWLQARAGEGAPLGVNSIQLVPLFDTLEGRACVAFCNEEGKLYDLPVNQRATVLWQDAIERRTRSRQLDDVLVGTIVILSGDAAFMGAL